MNDRLEEIREKLRKRDKMRREGQMRGATGGLGGGLCEPLRPPPDPDADLRYLLAEVTRLREQIAAYDRCIDLLYALTSEGRR